MSIAPSAVWAQTYYPLNSPGTITFGNFNFTMGTCTYQLNNGSSTNCNNDDLEMSVTTTANSITLTYMNSLSPGSALLSQATANGCTCVQYNFTVTNTKGLSQALVKDTGYGQSGDTLDNWLETYGTSTKLAQAGITTNGYQSQSSTYYAAGDTTSMNLELGLGVNAAYQTGVLEPEFSLDHFCDRDGAGDDHVAADRDRRTGVRTVTWTPGPQRSAGDGAWPGAGGAQLSSPTRQPSSRPITRAV